MWQERQINSNYQQQKTWRDIVNELKIARDDLKTNGPIMTNYEQQLIKKSITDRSSEVGSMILGQAANEYKQKIANYQQKHKEFENAKAKETQRWDMQKLAGEMTAIKQLVDMTIEGNNNGSIFGGDGAAAPKLAKIYQDAMRSDNIHTQRAAGEVFSNLSGTMPKHITDKADVNGIARGAKNDLENLRFTDQMVDALDNRNKAAAEVGSMKNDLREAALAIGDDSVNDAMFTGGPFNKLLKMTRQNPDGSMEIFAEDSVEVTGIKWTPEQLVRIGGNNE